MSGENAMARLPGIVQGVVVQMTTLAPSSIFTLSAKEAIS